MTKYEVIYNNGVSKQKEVVKGEEGLRAVINKIKINRWDLVSCIEKSKIKKG